MKIRCFSKPDGSLAFVTFAEEARLKNEPDNMFMERVWNQLKKNDKRYDTSFIDIDPSELPERVDKEGNSLREKWKLIGNKIIIDEGK